METKAKTTNKRTQETHSIECKCCGAEKKASINTTGYTCWECVVDSWSPEDAPKRKSVGYPKGWRFMKQFVHESGTVYFRGEEQPDLKGTLPVTPLAVKELKIKKSKVQKSQEKLDALSKFGKLKKELAKETRLTYRRKIEAELKRLQKLL
jgi:hypothetical protein